MVLSAIWLSLCPPQKFLANIGPQSVASQPGENNILSKIMWTISFERLIWKWSKKESFWRFLVFLFSRWMCYQNVKAPGFTVRFQTVTPKMYPCVWPSCLIIYSSVCVCMCTHTAQKFAFQNGWNIPMETGFIFYWFLSKRVVGGPVDVVDDYLVFWPRLESLYFFGCRQRRGSLVS